MENNKVDVLDEYQKEHEAQVEQKISDAEQDALFNEKIANLPEAIKNRWEDFFFANREQALYEASYFHEYLGALIGFSNTDVGIYSHARCIQCLIDSYTEDDIRTCNPDIAADEKIDAERLAELKYEMASEWFDYNVLRALPYEYDKAPIILYHFVTDEEN